jgi:hypothetical protein
MQNVRLTPRATLYRWPVISGVVITVARSLPGAGHSGYATASPCGLVIAAGCGRLLYRRGSLMLERATKFSLNDGNLYAKRFDGQSTTFSMLPLSRHILTVIRSLTFISLRYSRLPNGSRTWLCTPVLVIKRKR